MNNWTISGRIGRDAETKAVGDTNVTEFAVAVDKRVKGEKVTDWVDCKLWGDRGDKLAPYLTKGSTVSVSGEASARGYEKAGEIKTVLSLRVNQVTLLGKGGERQEDPKPAPRPAPKPAPADDFADDDIPFDEGR